VFTSSAIVALDVVLLKKRSGTGSGLISGLIYGTLQDYWVDSWMGYQNKNVGTKADPLFLLAITPTAREKKRRNNFILCFCELKKLTHTLIHVAQQVNTYSLIIKIPLD